MSRLLFAASTLAFSLAAAGSAVAQEGTWIPKAQGSRIGAEIDWWPTDDSHSVTFGLVGQIQLHRVVYLDFDVPWAVWDRRVSNRNRDATAVFGNPTVGAHWADTLNDRLSFFAGGTLSVATLVSGDGSDVLENLELYSARYVVSLNRAYADLHRFFPDHFFIRGKGGLELRILPVLFYRVDLTPILAIPVSDVGDDTDFILEIHNELEARARMGVGGGLHLQAVFNTDYATSSNPFVDHDAVQTAVEPYFVYEPLRGFYARAGVLVALDEDLGFGFNDGKVATIRAALGGKW